MHMFVGTSGYSYKEWKGTFYPEDLPDKNMLAYYAERLPAVEINNTFYRFPKESVLHSWAGQVPAHFRFVIKASQKITHFKRLKDVGDETEYLLRTVRALGEKLGVILFQCPPNLPKDLDRLKTFLDLFPDERLAAFEFRHASWFADDVYALLRERGSALCLSDTDDGDETDAIVGTTTWGYLRLRRSDYPPAALKRWKTKIDAQGWEKTYVFFKHEDEGVGASLAMKFLSLNGTSPATGKKK